MSRLVSRLVIVLLLVACGAPEPAPEPAPAFPRLATYYIETHVDAEVARAMARSDLIVVDAEAGALDRAPLDALRRERPDALLLAYLTSEEVDHTPDASQPLAAERLARIPPSAWVVEPGSTLTAAVSATATRLPVKDGAAFTLRRPRSAFYGEDEPTYLLIGGEHVRLVGIEGNTLVVERGYRSRAVAHPAGRRVASHVVFFGGTWMLNLSADAPGPWREMLADEAARLVARGPWNGVFLDVCFSDISWLNGGLFDLDRDGRADDPDEGSRAWSAGMGLLVDTLRERLPAGVPIVSNPGAQDCPHDGLDGILLEGWPIGLPPSYLDFEVGRDRYAAWSDKGRGLTIANAFSPKIGFGTIEAGQDELARTDYRAMRFGFALALMHDGFYAFDNGVFGHYVTWWYDEYDGAGRGRHWLGRALGDAHVQGTLRWRQFEHGLAVVNLGDAPAWFAPPGRFAKLAGTQDPVHNDGARVTGPLAIPPRDAYVLVRL